MCRLQVAGYDFMEVILNNRQQVAGNWLKSKLGAENVLVSTAGSEPC